jgi:hypothetical protein
MKATPVRLPIHLSRLLLPGEKALYSVLWYPLRDWPWLLAGIILLVLSLRAVFFLVLALAVLFRWNLPRLTNVVVVTNRRLLLRLGDFKMRTEAFDASQIDGWRVRQNLPMVLLHVGTVELDVRHGNGVTTLVLPWVWHPLSLVEALEQLLAAPLEVGSSKA